MPNCPLDSKKMGFLLWDLKNNVKSAFKKSHNLPHNRPFLPHNFPWKYRRISHFSRTLSEALTRELVPIDQQINNLLQQQIKRNCEILESLFKTIIFCGKNNIALRGPQDDDPQNASPSGNFQALLAFRIDSSEKTLQHHLETVPTNATYIS